MVKRVEHRHESDTPLRLVAFQIVELEADIRQAKTGCKAFGSSETFSTVIDADESRPGKTLRQFAGDLAGPAAKIEHVIRRLYVRRRQVREPANCETAGIGVTQRVVQLTREQGVVKCMIAVDQFRRIQFSRLARRATEFIWI
jgi:hypothetical protein